MDVVDEVVHRAVGVLDILEVRAGVLGERAGGVVVGAGEENHLGRCAGVADGGYGGLDGVAPFGHRGAWGGVRLLFGVGGALPYYREARS